MTGKPRNAVDVLFDPPRFPGKRTELERACEALLHDLANQTNSPDVLISIETLRDALQTK